MFCCTDLFLPRWLPTLGLLLLTACHGSKPTVFPSPLPTQPSATVREIAERFDVVCPPGPHGARVASVISPRFGLPVFSVPSASFPIELLARGQSLHLSLRWLLQVSMTKRRSAVCPPRLEVSACRLCWPTSAAQTSQARVLRHSARRRLLRGWRGLGSGGPIRFRSAGAAPPQCLDRAKRSVVAWAAAHRPPVGSASGQASGDDGRALGSLKAAIQRVNAEKPDLVVLTGDVVEDGLQEEWHKRAKTELLAITAPLAIVLGNHDYAHFPKIRSPDKAPDGYFAFSREFHSLRRYGFAYHGWDFIGFDSGPSVFAVRVLTRGVDKETVGWLGQRVEDAANHGRRGWSCLAMHRPEPRQFMHRTARSVVCAATCWKAGSRSNRSSKREPKGACAWFI